MLSPSLIVKLDMEMLRRQLAKKPSVIVGVLLLPGYSVIERAYRGKRIKRSYLFPTAKGKEAFMLRAKRIARLIQLDCERKAESFWEALQIFEKRRSETLSDGITSLNKLYLETD